MAPAATASARFSPSIPGQNRVRRRLVGQHGPVETSGVAAGERIVFPGDRLGVEHQIIGNGLIGRDFPQVFPRRDTDRLDNRDLQKSANRPTRSGVSAPRSWTMVSFAVATVSRTVRSSSSTKSHLLDARRHDVQDRRLLRRDGARGFRIKDETDKGRAAVNGCGDGFPCLQSEFLFARPLIHPRWRRRSTPSRMFGIMSEFSTASSSETDKSRVIPNVGVIASHHPCQIPKLERDHAQASDISGQRATSPNICRRHEQRNLIHSMDGIPPFPRQFTKFEPRCAGNVKPVRIIT